jgi:hypothetical protein
MYNSKSKLFSTFFFVRLPHKNDIKFTLFDITYHLLSMIIENNEHDNHHNNDNRIAGGIGAVISWIPIKAYRPCPNFINRGGTYERSGQGLDEIAFGRDSTFNQ